MHGELFILSAPSGAGKTTLLKEVMRVLPGLVFSISHTTRAPRAGETDGVDYHFVDRDSFLRMRDREEFLEWAEVHGNWYGTSRQAVEVHRGQGIDVILDIDVQGADQVRSRVPGCQSIFIAPPSLAELRRRLAGRGTDSAETIAVRTRNAEREMQAMGRYDYVIVNDDVTTAADTLRSVIVAQRCRKHRDASGKPLSLEIGPSAQ